MRCHHRLLSHFSRVSLLSLWVLCVPLVLAQTISFSRRTPVQLVALARVPEAQTHIAYPKLPLSPRQKSGFLRPIRKRNPFFARPGKVTTGGCSPTKQSFWNCGSPWE